MINIPHGNNNIEDKEWNQVKDGAILFEWQGYKISVYYLYLLRLYNLSCLYINGH
jgi:hypothetical protein